MKTVAGLIDTFETEAYKHYTGEIVYRILSVIGVNQFNSVSDLLNMFFIIIPFS